LYPLSLHDALPISRPRGTARPPGLSSRTSPRPPRPLPSHAKTGLEDLQEHPRPVSQHADLASGLIGPVHGHLDDTIPGGTRPEEKLDVEGETPRGQR